jgi:hypothetical protein
VLDGDDAIGQSDTMAFGPRISGERVVLRELRPSDRDARQALGRHAEIQRMFGAAHPEARAMTIDEAERWVGRRGGEDVIEWIIEHQGDFLGHARLHSFEKAVARATRSGFSIRLY